MIAAMVLTNLLYVVGAIIAATLFSAFIVFRHRRPKSLEAGIEMFSRELRALQPERRSGLGLVIGSGNGGPGQNASDPDEADAGGVGTDVPSGQALVDGEAFDDETRPTGRFAPDGDAGSQTRHVTLRANGASKSRYSTSDGARAPSPDIGDQSG